MPTRDTMCQNVTLAGAHSFEMIRDSLRITTLLRRVESVEHESTSAFQWDLNETSLHSLSLVHGGQTRHIFRLWVHAPSCKQKSPAHWVVWGCWRWLVMLITSRDTISAAKQRISGRKIKVDEFTAF